MKRLQCLFPYLMQIEVLPSSFGHLHFWTDEHNMAKTCWKFNQQESGLRFPSSNHPSLLDSHFCIRLLFEYFYFILLLTSRFLHLSFTTLLLTTIIKSHSSFTAIWNFTECIRFIHVCSVFINNWNINDVFKEHNMSTIFMLPSNKVSDCFKLCVDTLLLIHYIFYKFTEYQQQGNAFWDWLCAD